MLKMIESIPLLTTQPLTFVFEEMKLKHKPNTLWLEFGVFSGNTINYISRFTDKTVYGFDSFEGLPEKWRDGFDKKAFDREGVLPQVNSNVRLIKGWFDETLVPFINSQNSNVSFLHMDADLYSSTKYVLNTLQPYLAKDCVIVFDELVGYPGFEGEKGELKAFYEFVTEHRIQYTWIGGQGERVGVIVH